MFPLYSVFDVLLNSTRRKFITEQMDTSREMHFAWSFISRMRMYTKWIHTEQKPCTVTCKCHLGISNCMPQLKRTSTTERLNRIPWVLVYLRLRIFGGCKFFCMMNGFIWNVHRFTHLHGALVHRWTPQFEIYITIAAHTQICDRMQAFFFSSFWC